MDELLLHEQRLEQLYRMISAHRRLIDGFGASTGPTSISADELDPGQHGDTFQHVFSVMIEQGLPNARGASRALVRRICYGVMSSSKVLRMPEVVTNLASGFLGRFEESVALRAIADKLADTFLQVRGLREADRKTLIDLLKTFSQLGAPSPQTKLSKKAEMV